MTAKPTRKIGLVGGKIGVSVDIFVDKRVKHVGSKIEVIINA